IGEPLQGRLRSPLQRSSRRGPQLSRPPESSSDTIAAVRPGEAILTSQIISLHPVDLAIIIVYFAMVLGIGFYLRKYTKSGEDFFLAGREMSAWVAGLSFLSAN